MTYKLSVQCESYRFDWRLRGRWCLERWVSKDVEPTIVEVKRSISPDLGSLVGFEERENVGFRFSVSLPEAEIVYRS